MEKPDHNVEEVKDHYEELKEKYALPGFENLAEDFDVEKAAEKETSFVLRDIRRVISEKMSAYLHFFENIMNPASPPMFIFTILKSLPQKDKDKIKELYKQIAKLQIQAMKLDTIYTEEAEAEYIKTSFTIWQDMKKDIHSLIESFDKSFSSESNVTSKGYFG